jgi:D-cysteine desulfhydrase
MLGKECHLFLTGPKPDKPSANLLLDVLSVATVHWVTSSDSRQPEMMKFGEEMRKKGRVPYIIEVGGSNPIGAWGYVEGFLELDRQLQALPPKPTSVVFASSSAGTHAGLLAGKVILSSKIKLLGIRADSNPGLEKTICSVANGCLKMQGLERNVSEDEVHLNSNYIGEGYAIPTKESRETFKRLWRSEGILLDLVYTAKAMSGLIDLARSGAFPNERVIFLHTGGVAAFFGSASYVPLETLLS